MEIDACLTGTISKPGDTEHRFCSNFGLWRKHWGIHTYVVKNFGGGMEKYNEQHFIDVPLTAGNLREIIDAIEQGKIRAQAGSDSSVDLSAFRRALVWVEQPSEYVTRFVSYSGND
jgi:hypothetical protein